MGFNLGFKGLNSSAVRVR